MKRIQHHLIVLLLIPVLGGCAATLPTGTPASRSSTASSPDIKAAIDRLLPDSLFPPASIGIRIASVRTGEPLYELHPHLLFTPASSQKLLTTAAALALLGPGHRFDTALRIDTTADPAIILTGSGDPLLDTDDIDTIAQSVTSLLPQRPGWTLVGDVSAFDDRPWGRGWMWDDEPDPTAMEISPLSVNHNCITVRVGPGTSPGQELVVTVLPPADFVSVRNEGTSTADTIRRPLNVTRSLREKGNVIHITGEMRSGDSAVTRRISISDPGRYFLALLAERLRLRGVPVTGTRLDTIPTAEPSAVVRIRTVDSVVTFMNTWSDNLAAECLLKTMGGRESGGRGTGEAGAGAMRGALARYGVDTGSVVVADGSGISRYNLVSAHALSDLLVKIAHDTTAFPLLWHSLPVAGRSGTLQKRMRNTAAEGNVRAKTGTMTGGSSLSGYARTAEGELVAFVILMQNYPGEAGLYRAVQDRVAAALFNLQSSVFHPQ